MPVEGETWLVITPSQGIEIQSIGSATALIQELAGPMHATLVTDTHGVWAFRWRPPPGVHTVTVPGEHGAPLGLGRANGARGGGPPRHDRAARHLAHDIVRGQGLRRR